MSPFNAGPTKPGMGRRWIPLAGLVVLALPPPAAPAAPLNRPDDPVVVTGAGGPVGGAPPGRGRLCLVRQLAADPGSGGRAQAVRPARGLPGAVRCAGNTSATSPSPPRQSSAMPTRARSWEPTPNPRSTRTTRSPSWPRTPPPRRVPPPTRPDVVAGSRVEIEVSDPLDGGAGLRVPVPPERLARPGRRPAVRDLQLQPDLGRLPVDLQATRRARTPRARPSSTPYYSRRLHRPLAGERAARPPRPAERRRHPRPHREPVHSRLLRAQHASPSPSGEGAFLANRSGPVRAIRAYPGRKQRADDRAPADLLRGPRGGHDLPPGPPRSPGS